ncbi:MAG: hypothetical protein AABY33_03795 [Pseudomonadota bacterium]|mgnify:CR=1 FL=1
MAQYIVTDLTRFNAEEQVCTAVIDMDSGQCLRPMPYLTSKNVEELNMHPGAILRGDISLDPSAVNPHVEDATRGKLEYHGPASGIDFKAVLDRSLSNSVELGFGITLTENQKHIPFGEYANCSIVTVKISPEALSIHEDQYKPGRIKASFTDAEGHYFSYLPITDRGFYDYAKKHQDDGQLRSVRQFIKSQAELYLRVGVSRRHQSGNRDGYWIQVNGIYTFPGFFEEIRKY